MNTLLGIEWNQEIKTTNEWRCHEKAHADAHAQALLLAVLFFIDWKQAASWK